MSVKGAGRQYTGEIQTENQINKNRYKIKDKINR